MSVVCEWIYCTGRVEVWGGVTKVIMCILCVLCILSILYILCILRNMYTAYILCVLYTVSIWYIPDSRMWNMPKAYKTYKIVTV